MTERDFIPYPTNRIVGTVADVTNARAAIDALLQAGFVREDIDILHADEGVHRLDPTGEDHGFLAQFQRTLLRNLAQVEEHKRAFKTGFATRQEVGHRLSQSLSG